MGLDASERDGMQDDGIEWGVKRRDGMGRRLDAVMKCYVMGCDAT